MKGLILKEILQLRNYKKTIMILLAFLMIFSIVNKNFSFASALIVVVSVMMVMTGFAYDDMAKWDGYVLSMPLKKNKIVLCKYILSILLAALGSLVSIILGYFMDIITNNNFSYEDLLGIGVSVEAALILVSILIPLIYKFGVEKSRYILMMIFLLPTIIALVFGSNSISMPSEDEIIILLKASPIITVLIFIMSYLISSSIYESKEF